MKTYNWKIFKHVKGKTYESVCAPIDLITYYIEGEISNSPNKVGLFCFETRKMARKYIRAFSWMPAKLAILKIEVNSDDECPNDQSVESKVRANIFHYNEWFLFKMKCYNKIKLTSIKG